MSGNKEKIKGKFSDSHILTTLGDMRVFKVYGSKENMCVELKLDLEVDIKRVTCQSIDVDRNLVVLTSAFGRESFRFSYVAEIRNNVFVEREYMSKKRSGFCLLLCELNDGCWVVLAPMLKR